MPHVEFKTVDHCTQELLRRWRNLPRISNNMVNNSHISESQQKAWLDELLADHSRQYFVCYLDDTPVGALYFTDIDTLSCSWGCYIGEERIWPGLGLVFEFSALEYAFNILNVKELNADVLKFNLPPQKLHHFFLYQLHGDEMMGTIRNNTPLIIAKYRYTHDDWLKNKDQIIAKLPPRVVEVSQNVKFN